MENSISFMARDGVISLDTFLKTRKFKNGMGIIFLNRNVVSPVTSNSLKDKFSSLKHYRFSVILSAMEGKNKRLPTHEEYIEEYQKSSEKIGLAFGEDRVDREKIESFYYAVKGEYESHINAEYKFLAQSIEILKDKTLTEKAEKIIELTHSISKEHPSKMNPLLILLVFCHLYKGRGRHFIDKLLKVNKQEPLEQKLHNVISDLMIITLVLISISSEKKYIAEADANNGKVKHPDGSSVTLNFKHRFVFCSADAALLEFYMLYIELHEHLHVIFRHQKRILNGAIEPRLHSVCAKLFPGATKEEAAKLLNEIHSYIL